MKHIKYMLLLTTALLTSHALWSQTPVPDPDTLSTPIKQGDPALRTMPPRLDYIEKRKRITAEEVPEPVRQTLQSDSAYDDWQDAALYYDENTEEYILEFRKAAKARTYRFNKAGKRILEK